MEEAFQEICPKMNKQSFGYHLTEIPKGVLGELSKIQEELDELKDAESQGCRIMELLELSDLLGAVEAYLETHHPGFRLVDILRMSNITARAFKAGERK